MIYESYWWKRELLRIARDLRARQRQFRWPEASLARIEINVMQGFYMVRKLIEAHKISDSIAKQQMRIPAFPPSGPPPTMMNSHRVDALYNLSRPRIETRTVAFLCNQVIHSYVFILCFGEAGGWDGMIVTSDHNRKHGALHLPGRRIISLFTTVARNDPSWISWHVDPQTMEESIRVGPNLPSSP